MSKEKYYVTTWDMERQEFTPQRGVRTGPYSLFGLRKALRRLQDMGYETSKRGGVSVLIESRDDEK